MNDSRRKQNTIEQQAGMAIHPSLAHSFFNDKDTALFIVDIQFSCFLYISNNAASFWKTPIEILYERPLSCLEEIHDDDQAALMQFFTEKSETNTEITVQKKDSASSVQYLTVKLAPIKREDAEFTHYLGTWQDISRTVKEKQKNARMKDHGVETAARIQKTLLRGKLPKPMNGLHIAIHSLPSQAVDGDFYDFFALDGESLDFLIGDVMGKGVEAALLGAASKAILTKILYKNYAKAVDTRSLPNILHVMSDAEAEMSTSLLELESFITLYYCRIELQKSLLSFVDCGHTPFVYYCHRDQSFWHVKGANMPLGFIQKQKFRSYSLPINTNDLLFFYSDGLTEVSNSEGAVFGEERLRYLLKNHINDDVDTIIQSVVETVFHYSQEGFHDDVSSIAIRFCETSHRKCILEKQYSRSHAEGLNTFRFDLTEKVFPLLNLQETVFDQLVLALYEIMSNIIKHNPEHLSLIDVYVQFDRQYFITEFSYDGKKFPWHRYTAGELSSFDEKGYGMFIIDSVMSSVLHLAGQQDKKRIICLKEL